MESVHHHWIKASLAVPVSESWGKEERTRREQAYDFHRTKFVYRTGWIETQYRPQIRDKTQKYTCRCSLFYISLQNYLTTIHSQNCNCLDKLNFKKKDLKIQLDNRHTNSYGAPIINIYYTMPAWEWNRSSQQFARKKNQAASFGEELTALRCLRCNAANKPCHVSPDPPATRKSRSFCCFL